MLNTFRVTVLGVIVLGLYYTWVTGGTKTRFGRQAYTPSYPVSCQINNAVGLTYDEGPSTVTKDILSYLAAANVTTTFHVVTVYLVNNLNLQSYVKAAYSAGHDIGLRFSTQLNAGNITLAAFQTEILAESQIIYNLIGVWPKFLRLGGVSSAAIDAWCTSQGFIITGYAVDPMDYSSTPTAITATYSSYLSKLVGGQSFISYESDLYTQAAQALPNTLGVIAGYSYKVTPLSKCLATSSYRSSVNTGSGGSGSGGGVAGTSAGSTAGQSSDATTQIQFMSIFIAVMILGALMTV